MAGYSPKRPERSICRSRSSRVPLVPRRLARTASSQPASDVRLSTDATSLGALIAGGCDHLRRFAVAVLLVALDAVQLETKKACPPFRRGHPGAHLPGRLVSHVLTVTARQLGDPAAFLVEVVPDDRLLQAMALHASCTARSRSAGAGCASSSNADSRASCWR